MHYSLVTLRTIAGKQPGDGTVAFCIETLIQPGITGQKRYEAADFLQRILE
jgi:hypothetical protein